MENSYNSRNYTTLSSAVKQLIMLLVAFLVLYPLVFVFMTSFKTSMDVIVHPFTMNSFRPQNYADAWVLGRVGQYFFNSVITTAVTLAIQLIIIILGAYAF